MDCVILQTDAKTIYHRDSSQPKLQFDFYKGHRENDKFL
jgi:hypothetical protein